jgi:hypothetical protein
MSSLIKSYPHAKITCGVDAATLQAPDARIAARKMDQVYNYYLGQAQFFRTRAAQLIEEVAKKKRTTWSAMEELTQLHAEQKMDLKRYAQLIEGQYTIDFVEREAGDERGFNLLAESAPQLEFP